MTDLFVAIDVETTGLDPAQHEICQFGYTIFTRETIFANTAHDVYVSPHARSKAQPKALEVNGFTAERMSHGVPLEVVAARFETEMMRMRDRIDDCRLNAVYHNASFDVAFLKASGWMKGKLLEWFVRRPLDTVTMGWMCGARELSLENLATDLLNPREMQEWKKHDAGSDSYVTALLAMKLMNFSKRE